MFVEVVEVEHLAGRELADQLDGGGGGGGGRTGQAEVGGRQPRLLKYEPHVSLFSLGL